MALISTNAPRRAWPIFAKLFQKRTKGPRRLDRFPKDISQHLAKDLGLSAHDLEVLRHEWPSERHQNPL